MVLEAMNIMNISVSFGSIFKSTNSFQSFSQSNFSNGYIENMNLLTSAVFIKSDISYFMMNLVTFKNCSSSGQKN